MTLPNGKFLPSVQLEYLELLRARLYKEGKERGLTDSEIAVVLDAGLNLDCGTGVPDHWVRLVERNPGPVLETTAAYVNASNKLRSPIVDALRCPSYPVETSRDARPAIPLTSLGKKDLLGIRPSVKSLSELRERIAGGEEFRIITEVLTAKTLAAITGKSIGHVKRKRSEVRKRIRGQIYAA